jgi:uncharacterized protein with NRDE domain
MCLIILGWRASDALPLILAANRDEDHARPTLAASWWSDAPRILGGRDELQGGTWLAISRNGRFAAVTNLRGARPKARSRGLLVRNFVMGEESPPAFAQALAREAADYAGFHLLAGVIGGDVVHYSNHVGDPRLLDDGIDGFSNAAPGERWPKVDRGVERMRAATEGNDDAQVVAESMLDFLATPGDAPIESTPFVTGERYGTRSSTAIVVTRAGHALFIEQNWLSGGARDGPARTFRFRIER